jgi:hypothetical protein
MSLLEHPSALYSALGAAGLALALGALRSRSREGELPLKASAALASAPTRKTAPSRVDLSISDEFDHRERTAVELLRDEL